MLGEVSEHQEEIQVCDIDELICHLDCTNTLSVNDACKGFAKNKFKYPLPNSIRFGFTLLFARLRWLVVKTLEKEIRNQIVAC